MPETIIATVVSMRGVAFKATSPTVIGVCKAFVRRRDGVYTVLVRRTVERERERERVMHTQRKKDKCAEK
jgi:hypothetical protein